MRESRKICLAVFLAALIAQSERVDGADVTASLDIIGGAGLERGVTRVLCARENSSGFVRTRAIILNVSQSDLAHDVLLAPSHGLPSDLEVIKKDCNVVGASGAAERIVDIWLPEDRGDVGAADWAVLMTGRPIQGEISRLSAGVLAPDTLQRLVTDEAAITLMMHSVSADQDDCTMLNVGRQSKLRLQSGLFLHSCQTWAGVSGAPIVAGVNGEPVVIGFNIASQLRPQSYEGPLYLGLARVIDEQIASAIKRAAERASMVGKSDSEHVEDVR